jgi:hypothetical protein
MFNGLHIFYAKIRNFFAMIFVIVVVATALKACANACFQEPSASQTTSDGSHR